MKKRSVFLTGTVASLAEMVTGASRRRPAPAEQSGHKGRSLTVTSSLGGSRAVANGAPDNLADD
jgi:hypothetical protein